MAKANVPMYGTATSSKHSFEIFTLCHIRRGADVSPGKFEIASLLNDEFPLLAVDGNNTL